MRYRKPQTVYKSKNERARDLCEQQQAFVRETMHTLMHQPEVEVVYIDETSFNLWQSPSRLWLKPGMKIELVNSRGVSISMIGGLSFKRGIVHATTFAGSNNSETFLRFILGLKEKCPGPTVVVMDNLSVHKSKLVKGVFDRRFQQVFLPPQSCNLNPIEKVWNLVKSNWRKVSHLVSGDSNTQRANAAVDRLQAIVEGQCPEKMKRVARSNYENMARSLRGHLI